MAEILKEYITDKEKINRKHAEIVKHADPEANY